MGDYGYRKVQIGRHWRRPKAKVYECNMREAERWYQDNYKEYKSSKEFAAQRAAQPETPRPEDDSFSARWRLRRTNSVREGSKDSPHSSQNQGARREGSLLSSGTAESYRSPFNRQHSGTFAGASTSGTVNEESTTVRTSRSSSVVAGAPREVSPDTEINNIEQRLQRLRKLREELGLPSNIGGGAAAPSSQAASLASASTNNASASSNTTTSFSSSRKTTRGHSPLSNHTEHRESTRSRALDRSRDLGSQNVTSGTSIRSSSRSRRDDADRLGSDIGRLDRKREKSVTFNDDAETISSKSSTRRRNAKASDSISSKSTAKQAVAPTMNDDASFDFDDDAYLANIKKKFPTSEEILSRIRKMDDDL